MTSKGASIMSAEINRTAFRLPYSLVIPVRNGGKLLLDSVAAVLRQTVKPTEIIIFDTESSDGAIAEIKKIRGQIPLRLISIHKNEFDHGGTRNAALKLAREDWVLFLTQDAVCNNDRAVEQLLSNAKTKGVTAVYGRQLPHLDATPLAATARTINYGTERIVQNMDTAQHLGIKAWFTSNSFCLWHKPSLMLAGGFAEKLILGEDMHAAARLVQAGATVIYEPLATVRHSHNYSAWQEFTRYFDIGVFHAQNVNLLFKAGSANKEGFRFVLKQAFLLWNRAALLSLARMPFHVMAKFLGYKLGRKYTLFGKTVCRIFSMHKGYWQQ
jgi:rhamnosyltransferase